MPVANAQGTTLSWGAASFSLTSFEWSASANIIDITSMDSTIVTTTDGRVVVTADHDCGAIDNGKLNINFFGASNIGLAELGSKETLTLSVPDSLSLSCEAFLENISTTGSVNNVITGSAVFALSET